MVTATITRSSSTTAKIDANNTNGPKTVSVTVPAQQNLIRNSDLLLKSLGDVDAVNAQEGGILQYRAIDGKFVLRTLIDTQQGELRLTGGTF